MSDMESYHLKWIPWNSGKIPIVMQSRNGPCPLIATMNVLLLREKIKLPDMLEQITADQLLTYLGESIMDCVPPEHQSSQDDIATADTGSDNAILNYEQHINDAMEILPKLKTGLDVNIRFTGITDFEYTPAHIIFDLLRIPVYHGWLIDPNLSELQAVISNQSYNQLVDYIITNKNSKSPEISVRVIMAEEFLEQTASQLTLFGLNELKSNIKNNEIGILFRNNHFLTLFKREDEIYTLVTDHGYLTEDNIIWETLDNIEGAGRFFDAGFIDSQVTNKQVSEFDAIDQRQKQMENDFLMALSLEEERLEEGDESSNDPARKAENDFELAKRLQEEEDKAYEEMIRSRQVANTSTTTTTTLTTTTTTTSVTPDTNLSISYTDQPYINELPYDERVGSSILNQPNEVESPIQSNFAKSTSPIIVKADELLPTQPLPHQLNKTVSTTNPPSINEPSSSMDPQAPLVQPSDQRQNPTRPVLSSRQSIKSERNAKESTCKLI